MLKLKVDRIALMTHDDNLPAFTYAANFTLCIVL